MNSYGPSHAQHHIEFMLNHIAALAHDNAPGNPQVPGRTVFSASKNTFEMRPMGQETKEKAFRSNQEKPLRSKGPDQRRGQNLHTRSTGGST